MSEESKNPFIIEKAKKTGYYLDTPENRKLGRVGQKYTIEVSKNPQDKLIQRQLDSSRSQLDRFNPNREVSGAIDQYERDQERRTRQIAEMVAEDPDFERNRIANRRRASAAALRVKAREAREGDTAKTEPVTHAERVQFVKDYDEKRKRLYGNIIAVATKLKEEPTNKLYQKQLNWFNMGLRQSDKKFNKKIDEFGIRLIVPEEFVSEEKTLTIQDGHLVDMRGEPADLNNPSRVTVFKHKGENIVKKQSKTLFDPRISYEDIPDLQIENSEQLNTIKDYVARLPEFETVEGEAFDNIRKFMRENGVGESMREELPITSRAFTLIDQPSGDQYIVTDEPINPRLEGKGAERGVVWSFLLHIAKVGSKDNAISGHTPPITHISPKQKVVVDAVNADVQNKISEILVRYNSIIVNDGDIEDFLKLPVKVQRRRASELKIMKWNKAKKNSLKKKLKRFGYDINGNKIENHE